MYFEKEYKFDNVEQSNNLQDDCLAAFGVALMLTQLGA